MIRRNNKSGVDYTVDKLSPGGKLYFNTPKQMVPNLNKNFTEEGARKLAIFYENPGEFLTNNAGLAKLDNGKCFVCPCFQLIALSIPSSFHRYKRL